jgi:hypothetical protein
MTKPVKFVSITPASTTTPSRGKEKSWIGIGSDASQLSLLRLSFAALIIGTFWMVVRLHEYVVWLRGDEKALLLVFVLASCVALYADKRILTYQGDNNREIEHIFLISLLILLTLMVVYLTYLTVSEPSPISLQLSEVPGARSLQLQALIITATFVVPFCSALAGFRIPRTFQAVPIYIMGFFSVGALCHLIYLWYYTCGADFPRVLLKCHGMGLADIGGTTLNAVHAAFKGLNPYTIDIQGDYVPGSADRGYRYWPMMFAAYMPITAFFNTGWGAIRLTNFILDGIAVALIIVLAGRLSGWLSGVLAASLYLMLPIVANRLYAWADTDLVPVVFLLAALAVYQSRPSIAGLLVGLSVSAKFVPGLLMLICCFPEARRAHYITGFVLGLIPALAFCLLAPSEFISNTVMCIVSTTSFDSSSWQYGGPVYLNTVAQSAVVFLIAAVSWLMVFRPPDLYSRCTLYVICVVATLLASHVHNNYMLWWIPFFCILLSSPVSRILSLPGKAGSRRLTMVLPAVPP